MHQICCLAFLCSMPAVVMAQACLIETGQGATKVRVCQQNLSIPAGLFAEGFCRPQLSGQEVKISMLDSCPSGAFGVCRNAQTAGTQIPYQQDIYYYGQPTDARFLEPACLEQNKGHWQQQKPPINQTTP